jgi:hypothetical protein
VKVAFVDSGVDWLSEDLRYHLKYGISSAADVATGKELPWWHVYDEHGTQMASLIRKVNPYCKIYPARAERARGNMKMRDAAKVINRLLSTFKFSHPRSPRCFCTIESHFLFRLTS